MNPNHTAILAFSPLIDNDEPKTIAAPKGFRTGEVKPARVVPTPKPAPKAEPAKVVAPAQTTDNTTAMRAEIEKLKAENARLAAQRKNVGGLAFKVSEKGAVSVYGMGRFPVTLYREQWAKLFEASADIAAFIEANKGALKAKGE